MSKEKIYNQRTLRNGNRRLENEDRSACAMFDVRKNKVVFNSGIDKYIVRAFERGLKR